MSTRRACAGVRCADSKWWTGRAPRKSKGQTDTCHRTVNGRNHRFLDCGGEDDRAPVHLRVGATAWHTHTAATSGHAKRARRELLPQSCWYRYHSTPRVGGAAVSLTPAIELTPPAPSVAEDSIRMSAPAQKPRPAPARQSRSQGRHRARCSTWSCEAGWA